MLIADRDLPQVMSRIESRRSDPCRKEHVGCLDSLSVDGALGVRCARGSFPGILFQTSIALVGTHEANHTPDP